MAKKCGGMGKHMMPGGKMMSNTEMKIKKKAKKEGKK